jgi:hypothetical protein
VHSDYDYCRLEYVVQRSSKLNVKDDQQLAWALCVWAVSETFLAWLCAFCGVSEQDTRVGARLDVLFASELVLMGSRWGLSRRSFVSSAEYLGWCWTCLM